MIRQQTVEHMGASLAVDALEMARQPTAPAGLTLRRSLGVLPREVVNAVGW